MHTGPVKSNTLRRGGGFCVMTRGVRPMRCTLPMTAFLVTPMRRPISAVVTPSSHNRVNASMRSGVQVPSTLSLAGCSSIGSGSVHAPSMSIPPYAVVGSTTATRYSTTLVGRCQRLSTSCVAGRGKTTTPISYHLRKVSDRARLGGKARPNEPVEVRGEVTRVVWLMKGVREIVEQGVVIGL